MTGKFLFTVFMAVYSLAGAVEEYQANWESLRQHQNPEWALDAKFGIYCHWGPYTETGAWKDNPYINWGNYYITAYNGIYDPNPDEARRSTFEKRYGSITTGVGYRDLCEDFSVEGFDPVGWADLIQKSGAKYAGICAIHHDGYAMWDSQFTEHCAGKTGPKRDIFGEMMTEIKKRGIKTIATFHHARTYQQFKRLQDGLEKAEIPGVDILDPENESYYWFLGTKERFTKNRKDLTYEVINKYKPDVLWFDGGGGGFGTEDILARFFNMGIEEGKEVCVHNKGNFGTNFGIYSYENGAHRPGFVDWPWEDDTPSAIGWCDWPWWYGIKYKTSRHVILRLADLVSRNGGLLLSVNPRPDGSFDQGQVDLLLGVGEWLKQNGNAIYGTRPWIIYAEGHVEPIFWQDVPAPQPERIGKQARPIQPDTTQFDHTDIRFTAKGNKLYAIQLAAPSNGKTIIRSLGYETVVSDQNVIQNVKLLGHGSVEFVRSGKKLEITLPKHLPNQVALAFEITVGGNLKQRLLEGKNKIIPMKT